jgi:hypothetical protein
MNWINDDYFLGHLLKQARATNLNRLEVDILTGTAKPGRLTTNSICDSIKHRCNWFPTLVVNSGASMDFVSSAIMIIEFDLLTARPSIIYSKLIETPFTCEIRIIDERGKEYNSKHEEWWYPES